MNFTCELIKGGMCIRWLNNGIGINYFTAGWLMGFLLVGIILGYIIFHKPKGDKKKKKYSLKTALITRTLTQFLLATVVGAVLVVIVYSIFNLLNMFIKLPTEDYTLKIVFLGLLAFYLLFEILGSLLNITDRQIKKLIKTIKALKTLKELKGETKK